LAFSSKYLSIQKGSLSKPLRKLLRHIQTVQACWSVSRGAFWEKLRDVSISSSVN